MMSHAFQVLLPAIISTCIGFLITPSVSNFLYKNKLWKKKSVATSLSGTEAVMTQKLHNDEERKVPRMGGIIVWGSVLITLLVLYIFSFLFNEDSINVISRGQTWILIAMFLSGALVGLVDDLMVCSDKGKYIGGGLSLKTRVGFVAILGLIFSWWFVFKLGITSLYIPFIGTISLGIGMVAVVILLMLLLYSGGIIDGIDGLAGGIFSIIFGAFAIIAYFQSQYDIAALCMIIIGALLAFLWFNIPPARFFLSETGTMALTVTLVGIAFLTNAVFVLPIITLPLILTSASSVLQILSKKIRNGKKIFKVAPLHNHFQAIGWPQPKVVMRYWIVSVFLALLGVIIHMQG